MRKYLSMGGLGSNLRYRLRQADGCLLDVFWGGGLLFGLRCICCDVYQHQRGSRSDVHVLNIRREMDRPSHRLVTSRAVCPCGVGCLYGGQQHHAGKFGVVLLTAYVQLDDDSWKRE